MELEARECKSVRVWKGDGVPGVRICLKYVLGRLVPSVRI